MLTYNTLYRPVDDGAFEQLQMAAWLQYLLDRLSLACTLSLAGRETHLIGFCRNKAGGMLSASMKLRCGR
ncbi:hypothetical protein WS68_11970 [Burkholderia sp. TSV86]|nr:hypothetical protein WS68_11970 [Burkholderia sp. TSV86]